MTGFLTAGIQKRQETGSRRFPGTYDSSDRLSITAQTLHFLLLAVQFAFLFLASLMGSLSAFMPSYMSTRLIAPTAILLALGLLAIWINRAQGYDKIWFSARAVAESVKTVAWRYMMRVSPFNTDTGDSLDARLLGDLTAILQARSDIRARLVESAGDEQITHDMRELRAAELDVRKDVYLRERLAVARAWYAAKARANQRAATVWFWATVAAQLCALVVAILWISIRSLPFTSISGLMMLAALFSAWTQAKRHDELTQSYALAAQELSSLSALQIEVASQESFADFVIQVEEAISREHTMWVARRNVVLG